MLLSHVSTESSRPIPTVFQETVYHSMCTTYLADFRTEPVTLRYSPTPEVGTLCEWFSSVLCLTDPAFVMLDLLMRYEASFCRQCSKIYLGFCVTAFILQVYRTDY
jgi:hypothetical protein